MLLLRFRGASAAVETEQRCERTFIVIYIEVVGRREDGDE